MVQNFTAFMYKSRQRASKSGKLGLCDSMAEMAQYIFAQVRLHAAACVMHDMASVAGMHGMADNHVLSMTDL